MKKILLIATILLAGCDEQLKYATPLQKPLAAHPVTERFLVSRVQIISDSLAYSGNRGIYIIKDNETGKEFIGVSGIGVSELGSHISGKTILSDER